MTRLQRLQQLAVVASVAAITAIGALAAAGATAAALAALTALICCLLIIRFRPGRHAAAARDDSTALRCTVNDRALVPDGSRTRIETSRLVGEVRFAQRREGKARCAIALAARPMTPLPPRLWFGVEVSEGESEPPRAFRALAGTLLTLARRLMSTEVRCELSCKRPLIAFDVSATATRFECWKCAAPAPLDAADGAPATDCPEPFEADRARVLAAVKEGRHLLCGNQNFTARSSTRRLLDGVAMQVPHRSTEPARPRRRREMT